MKLLPFEAEAKTGLHARIVTATINPEMKCQLGIFKNMRIDLPPLPSTGAHKGAQFKGLNGTFPVFHLKSYGEDFESAIELLNRNAKRKEAQ